MEKELKAKRKKGKYGYVDENGKWVIEPVYQVAWDFKEDFGRVKLPPRTSGKSGFVKPDGSYLIEPILDRARDFHDGFAAVKINDKWTFLKTDGTFLIDAYFDKVWDFYQGESLVKEGSDFHFLMADGSYKTPDKLNEYILKCSSFQNNDNRGWSFLDVSEINGKWLFSSWARQIDENQEWYDHKMPEDGELIEILRYTDKIEENKVFSNWANSLNLHTPEEIGQLLWANTFFLLMETKLEQKQGPYVAPLRDIVVLIQLYNQLQVIERLGLTKMKDTLNFLPEDYSNLELNALREKGIKMCEDNMLFDEDGFFDLNFDDFLKESRKLGEYEHMSEVELPDEET